MTRKWITSLLAVAMIAVVAFTGVEPPALPSAAPDANVVAVGDDVESAHKARRCSSSNKSGVLINQRHVKTFYARGSWWTLFYHEPTWLGERLGYKWHTDTAKCKAVR